MLMKKNSILSIVYAFCMLLPLNIYAQTQIEVVDESTDVTGEILVYRIKEGFRNSSAFGLNDGFGSRLQMRISTMPKFDDNPGIATIYSIIWLIVLSEETTSNVQYLYWDSTLGYCGRDVVVSTAQAMVARTDKKVTILRKALKDMNAD